MTGRALLRAALCCAVASVAMGAPTSAQPRLDFAGLHGGAIMSGRENAETLVGLHAGARWSGALWVVAALDLRSDFPDDPTGAWSGTAWWGYATARTHLPGPIRFIAVGAGIALEHASADNETRSLELSNTGLSETLVVGVGGRVWRLRPFVDLYLMGAIRSPTEPGAHLTAGVGWSRR